MVNNFIDNLINQEIFRKLSCSKELLKRIFSSFLFIPMIVLVWLLDDTSFRILCWIIYCMIVKEIFSQKISGHWMIRCFALIFCFLGIYSFIYVHDSCGKIGNVFLICVASLTDIGAYFFGKWLKGPKLCPMISPNKTWAGLIGGFLCCNLTLWAVYPSDFNCGFWGLQLLILSAILGDLLESALKRKLEIKDLGKTFPGHGGICDRLDSLLLVSIVFSVFCVFK